MYCPILLVPYSDEKFIVPSTDTFVLPTEHNGNQLSYNGVDLVMDGFENTAEYKSLIMYHTISSLGIKGIGPAASTKISEAGVDIKMLFSENDKGLRNLFLKNDVFKDGRELQVLINNIMDLTKVELWQIIYSFGYINCGKTISKQLANYVAGINYDFKGLIKDVVKQFVETSSRMDEVLELVDIMRNANIDVVYPVQIGSDMITFEMTGTNPSGESKGVYKNRIEDSNKAIHTALKSDTTYLVTDSLLSNSGKMKKADKNGTKIVTYEEFEIIIENLK